MSVDSKINIKVIKNNDVLINISEPIRLKDNKWSDYIKSLKTVQKSVNTYLTTLVDQEKSSGESMSIEEDCDDTSEDEDNCESSKRKLEVLDNNRKRKKKS